MGQRHQFQIINACREHNPNITEDEYKLVSDFMLGRVLSNSPKTAMLANLFNQHPKIPIEQQLLLTHLTVKGSRDYMRVPKNENSSEEFSKEALDVISRHYNVNIERAKIYAQELGQESITKLLWDYRA